MKVTDLLKTLTDACKSAEADLSEAIDRLPARFCDREDYKQCIQLRDKLRSYTMTTKERIIELLKSTKREGMDNLIKYLCESDFFEAPASTRFHGAYVGGLADHSLAVYTRLADLAGRVNLSEKVNWGQMPIKVESENLIVAGLLHDLSKIDAYVRTKADDGWTNNRDKEKGHAQLSLVRVQKYIALTKLEEMMIRYHMGVYGLIEYDDKSGEYHLTSGESGDTKEMTKEQKVASQKRRYGRSLRNAWYHNPVVKLMYFCDELAAIEESG
jgi:hypothetical protein